MERLFGAQGIYTKFKAARNRKICQFEGAFFFLNALLFIFAWIFMGLGFRLTGSITLSVNMSAFDKLHDSVVIFNLAMFIMLFMLSLAGMIFAADRFGHHSSKICYFIVLFFFVSIPLLAEGSILLKVNSFDAKKIGKICSKPRDAI